MTTFSHTPLVSTPLQQLRKTHSQTPATSSSKMAPRVQLAAAPVQRGKHLWTWDGTLLSLFGLGRFPGVFVYYVELRHAHTWHHSQCCPDCADVAAAWG